MSRLSVRERSPWVVGITSIVLIAIGVSLAFSVNKFDFVKGTYPIYADLKDAAGLQPGNEVRVAGVKVGSVVDITLTDKAARIKMDVQQDIQIPLETRLEVKLKTLLGQKFIELKFPRAYLAAASGGRPANSATAGFFEAGDVIPLDQTRVPFEIYQAATEGTARLADIDKKALRRMISTLADTVGASKEEIARLITSLEGATNVLDAKSPEISMLLRNINSVSGTLAASDQDLEGILVRSAEVFGTLAERRATTSSLLAATADLTNNLGILLEASRGSIQAGIGDLNSILLLVNDEYESISESLDELATAQKLFGQGLQFGRFIEGHVCSVTSANTCIPDGTPWDPGVPSNSNQPGSRSAAFIPQVQGR